MFPLEVVVMRGLGKRLRRDEAHFFDMRIFSYDAEIDNKSCDAVEVCDKSV